MASYIAHEFSVIVTGVVNVFRLTNWNKKNGSQRDYRM